MRALTALVLLVPGIAFGGELLAVDCAAPPAWHCPDSECSGAVVTQPGNTVETKTRRTFFLDCPSGYQPGDKVNILLSLHGFGSFANWQRNYFPALDVKDKHKLVVITPGSPVRFWSEADDQYLHNIIDLVVGTVGRQNVGHFILVGHSQGGLTTSRLVCTDYFRDKVDVRISLSGGRVGPVTAANRGFAGGTPVYRSGEPQAQDAAPVRGPPASAANGSYNLSVAGMKQFQVFGSISNLFDKSPPFTGGGLSGATAQYHDTFGRSYRFGVRLQF